MKKSLVALFFGFLLAAGAEASMISFYVIETGLPENSARNRHTQRWENTLLDVFFESGYIVSNAPLMRLSSKPSDGIIELVDVDEARDGGSDFVIVAQLDYTPNVSMPSVISLYAFRISQPNIIYEKQITGKNYRSERDEIEDLKSIISEMLPFFGNNVR